MKLQLAMMDVRLCRVPQTVALRDPELGSARNSIMLDSEFR
jgi:hypothetical protein